MADDQFPNPNRMLAPAALGVVAVLFLIIVVAGLSGGGSDSQSSPDTSQSEATSTRASTPAPKRPQAATYTVKLNDDLGKIAQKTNVPVEKIQELNPELDPQALVVGQKIKLRE